MSVIRAKLTAFKGDVGEAKMVLGSIKDGQSLDRLDSKENLGSVSIEAKYQEVDLE